MALITLRGEQDVHLAPAVERELQRASRDGCGIVVDLREATFLDSAVAGKLLEARKQAKLDDVPFVLVLSDAPANPVRRMFEQIGLTTVFATFDNQEQAVAAAHAGRFLEPGG